MFVKDTTITSVSWGYNFQTSQQHTANPQLTRTNHHHHIRYIQLIEDMITYPDTRIEEEEEVLASETLDSRKIHPMKSTPK